jgi:hypothetical protein
MNELLLTKLIFQPGQFIYRAEVAFQNNKQSHILNVVILKITLMMKKIDDSKVTFHNN